MERHEPVTEGEALRRLARQMAEVSDSEELLTILCEAASAQCNATGSAVVKAGEEFGEIVSACGLLGPAVRKQFPLRGSLFRDMAATRDVVGVDDLTAAARPLTRVAPDIHVGPLLVAPLIAHDSMIGGLAIARGPDAPAFSGGETERLRLIADHAALALWKADLLEQARAADAAKGRFLATISHELRTPLTALTGYQELFADEVLGHLTEPQRDMLERMRSVTQSLTAMIEDVLAYSSLEMGYEVTRPTDFLLGDLIRSVTAVIEPLARQKKLNFTIELPPGPQRLTTDIDRAQQILVNLAGNAVKFTDRGSVAITCIAKDRELHIAVRDTGIGIASADQRQLFQPFAQVDTGLTRRHGGTGLGLYISTRLARLLHGRIELKSDLGQGATFTFILPIGPN
jgi:signal transduction histidine kinase